MGTFLDTRKSNLCPTGGYIVNLQQTLDGSTMMSLWPDKEMSQINPKNDTEYYTRAAKK
jgi:hypothetical protein